MTLGEELRETDRRQPRDATTGLPGRESIRYLLEWMSEPSPEPMTGPTNRQALTPGIEPSSAIEQRAAVEPAQNSVALLLIDLARFSVVNELFGHDTGDLVLALIAERLREVIGENDAVVHYAGDEFAVLRPHPESQEEVELLARRIIETITAPIECRRYTITVDAFIGISIREFTVAPHDGAGPLESALMSEAKSALYSARQTNESGFVVYDPAATLVVSPEVLVGWLNDVLAANELTLHYQPVLSPTSSRIVALEALLRWKHPRHGIARPGDVLPGLEDSGLIVDVGRWVINEACRQLGEWNDAIGIAATPTLFVNTALQQLESERFVEELEAALARHRAEAGLLCLELGGLGSLPDRSTVWSTLRECKALGVKLSLDNFGSASSSFSLIRKLRLDYLKLDRTLVNARSTTRSDDAIASAAIVLARHLGYATVAEGVEDNASLERAIELGCDLAQGFLFGCAEPAETITRFLVERTALTPP
jgi:diguanylate cyclase (GGDEF)-like protein